MQGELDFEHESSHKKILGFVSVDLNSFFGNNCQTMLIKD